MDKTDSSYRQSFLMGTGTVINSLLGLVFYLLVARTLSVFQFGQFSFLLGLGLIGAELGDLGFGSTLVKFGDRKNFPSTFTLVLLQRLAVCAVYLLAALLLSRLFRIDLILASLVAVSLLFLSLITQSFLARQQYVQFVFVNVLGNLFRLVLLFLILNFPLLNVDLAVKTFFAANFFALSVGCVLLCLSNRFIPWETNFLKQKFVQVRSFTGWTALSFGLSSLSGKLDIPLVFALSGGQAAGIYSSAQKLVSLFPQVAASLEGVFSPKFASNPKNHRLLFTQYLILVSLICLGLLLLIPLAPILVPLLFGEKYLPAVGVFRLLLISLIPFFFSGPLASSILYRFGRSNYHFLVSIISLFISLGLYFLLVPAFGETGAAVTAILTNTAALIFYRLVFQKLAKHD